MNLGSTSTLLQVILGAAKTTNDCPCVVNYRKKTRPQASTATDGEAASSYTSTNGVTVATLLAAPTHSEEMRLVDDISVYNADTVATRVYVRANDGSSTYIVADVTLQPSETLTYIRNYGWSITRRAQPIGLLTNLSSAGTLFNTYTTAKTILPAANVITLPASFFAVGKMLEVEGFAGLSNIVTTPGTFVIQVKIGSVIAFTTGNIQLNATAHTLLPLWFKFLLTCRAVGSGTSANLMGCGQLQGIHPTLTAAQTDAANTGGIFSAPATAPTVGTGFDSTASQTVDLWAGFSISDAGNGIQLQQYKVTALN